MCNSIMCKIRCNWNYNTYLSAAMLDICAVSLASPISSNFNTSSWLKVNSAAGRRGRATSCSRERPCWSDVIIDRKRSAPQRRSRLSSSSRVSLTGERKTDRRWASRGSYWSAMCKRKARSLWRSGTSSMDPFSRRLWKEYCLKDLRIRQI